MNSKFEYVKSFELKDDLLPSTFIAIRIDGRAFKKYNFLYEFYAATNSDANLTLLIGLLLIITLLNLWISVVLIYLMNLPGFYSVNFQI